MQQEFQDWPLHDAVLVALSLDWAARSCRMIVSAWINANVGVRRCRLEWTGLTCAEVPMRQPWGPSVHVNALRRRQLGAYEIEMQSGDVIKIEAEAANFCIETAEAG